MDNAKLVRDLYEVLFDHILGYTKVKCEWMFFAVLSG
jgi:hypothetical protein